MAFLQKFAVTRTREYTSTPDYRQRCIIGTAPSLAVMENAYGVDVARFWLSTFFANLFEACGQRPTVSQIDALTDSLMSEYSHLKVTDYMLFAVKVRAGVFGKFYGHEDIMSIGTFLTKYCEWRSGEIAKWQRDEDRKKAEKVQRDIEENGIGLEEYCSRAVLTEEQKVLMSKYMAKSNIEREAIKNAKTAPKQGVKTQNG